MPDTKQRKRWQTMRARKRNKYWRRLRRSTAAPRWVGHACRALLMVFPAQFWKLLPIEIWSFFACVLSCWVSKFFWRGLLGGRLWACRVPGSSLAAVYRKRAPNFQKGPFFVACRKEKPFAWNFLAGPIAWKDASKQLAVETAGRAERFMHESFCVASCFYV